MKVILLNGSPRFEGCTFTALSEVEMVLNREGIETEIIQIGVEYSEELVKEVAAKIEASNGLIIGSPVYYASAAGISNRFLDRLFYNYIGRSMRMKPGAAVVSCRRGGASSTFDQLNKYFTISQMPVVSSNYWNSVHGNTPDEVRQDLEGMQVMRILGENMAYLIKALDIAKLELKETEKKVWTNFIRK